MVHPLLFNGGGAACRVVTFSSIHVWLASVDDDVYFCGLAASAGGRDSFLDFLRGQFF